jgi:uncharacterized protein (DUF433 family)
MTAQPAEEPEPPEEPQPAAQPEPAAEKSRRSRQRSFRLSARTLELLDQRAAALGVTRNALAERVLAENLRTERYPLIRFRRGASGVRRPALAGHRIYVSHVIGTVRDNDGSTSEAAEWYGLPEALVRAAVDYYAEFGDEVDAQIAADRAFEEQEYERWERAQRVLR